MVSLRKNMRVTPNVSHENYEIWEYQHENNKGTIIDKTSNGWYRVKWDNEHTNTYPSDFLIPIETNINNKSEITPILFLPGMRVCLNPESPYYKNIKNVTKSEIGYLLSYLINEEDALFNLINNIDFTVLVKFDNFSKNYHVKIYDLLPIDAPQVDVKHYYLNNGAIYYLIDKTMDELDEAVIIKRINIKDVKIYNDLYREKITEKFNKLLNNSK